jgi:broad specificity phosphatase PhoE
MLLYVVRHAQTASSAVDSFNGRGELPLTERGRDQARKLGQRLGAVPFAAVVRSPLGRTKETAELIVPGARHTVLPGLTEIDYGEWEGLSPEEARERDPELYDAWVEDPARIAPPSGETAAQVSERALDALREIEATFADAKGPILVVSHKATLRILGASITNAPVALYRKKWPQDECALNLIELRKNGDPFLRLWNDTAHLDPDPGRTTRPGK